MTGQAIMAERERVLAAIGEGTVCSAFLATASRKPGAVALRWVRDGQPRALTWAQYHDQVARLAGALRDLGVQRGDRVALLMRNCVEFHVADLASLFAGATPLSIYASSSPQQVRHALAHCGAVAVVVGDAALLSVLTQVRHQLPALKTIISARELPGEAQAVPMPRLLAGQPAGLRALAREVDPSQLATIIYTSGTTGTPKGVMLTHRNIRYAASVFAEVMGVSWDGLRQISYLPMAHIAERQATHYFHLTYGSDVTICEDIRRLPDYLLSVRPQWLFCAPRFWEKLRSTIEATLVADPARARRFEQARQVGTEVFLARSRGEAIAPELAGRWNQARAECVEPVLALVGLGETIVASSGSAAMPPQTSAFFAGCGLPLLDGYGLSETSGIATWEVRNPILGTAGRAYPGIEVDLAGDGEVLIRGPLVFPGYLDDPARTAEVLDPDGWLHTGDIGVLENGYLRIVDRKKEILVPSSGHNVSPAMLESALKESPLIGQACAIGDGRPYITALVVLDNELAAAWAREHGVPFGDMSELATAPSVLAAVDAHVAQVNERFAPAEQVKAVRILGEEWLPDSRFLTPTAKLKRRAVTSAYADLIDALYQDRQPA